MFFLHLYWGGSCSSGCLRAEAAVGTERYGDVMSRRQNALPDTSWGCHTLCSLPWQCEMFGMILTCCEQAFLWYLSTWVSSVSPWCMHLPVHASTVDQTWVLRHDQSKHWIWWWGLFALNLFKEVHIYCISQEQADDAEGCPTCCCCTWVNFAFDTHLPPFRSTESCR